MIRAPAPVSPQVVELRRVSIPFRRPHLSAHGTESTRESTVIEVTLDDGTRGWGECSALAQASYSGESAEGAFRVLRDVLAPMVLRGSPVGATSDPMARAGLEGALWDAALRSEGRNLAEALGAIRRRVESVAVVSAPEIDDLLRIVDARVGQGYRWVSVKINPGWDAEPLGAIRARWPELVLAADANGSYPDPGAVPSALRDLGLHHLEQPFTDVDPIPELVERTGLAVALDESVGSLSDLDEVLQVGGVAAVNVKPSRLGGFSPAVEVAERARGAGLHVFCGGMLETGIGRAHALAFAALDVCDLPTHLGPSANYFEVDLVDPFTLSGGAWMEVPAGPGIGVEPSARRLDEVTVARSRLER